MVDNGWGQGKLNSRVYYKFDGRQRTQRQKGAYSAVDKMASAAKTSMHI